MSIDAKLNYENLDCTSSLPPLVVNYPVAYISLSIPLKVDPEVQVN